MSLEEALNKNTAAVEKHNTLLEKMLAAGGTKAPATSAKAADKPAAAAKPAAKTTTNKGKAEPTLELVTEKITAFLKTGDAETRAEHKAQAAQIMEHFGAERFTQIPSEHWPLALAGLRAFEAGEIPEFLADAGDEGDGDEDDGDAMV